MLPPSLPPSLPIHPSNQSQSFTHTPACLHTTVRLHDNYGLKAGERPTDRHWGKVNSFTVSEFENIFQAKRAMHCTTCGPGFQCRRPAAEDAAVWSRGLRWHYDAVQSVGRSDSRTVGRSVGQLVGRSVGWLVGRQLRWPSVRRCRFEIDE